MAGAEELPRLFGGWTYIPPRPAGMGAVAPRGSVGADAALTGLASMFQALQTQAQRLQAVYGLEPLGPAQPLAYEPHCKTVGAYLTVAKAVFADLHEQGFEVVQKPTDVNGNPIGESRGDPLSPTTLPGCGAVVQPAHVVNVMLIRNGVITAPSTVTVKWPADQVRYAEAGISWLDRYLGCVAAARKGEPAAGLVRIDATCQTPRPTLRPSGGGLLAGLPWRRLGYIAAGSLGGILLVMLLTRSRRPAPPAPASTLGDDLGVCPCL